MSQLFDSKYPYTDFHELNLDWVIAKIQELNKNLDDLEERAVQAAIEASKEYVDERVSDIIGDFNRLSADFSRLESSLTSQFNALNSSVQAQVQLMSQRIEAFRDELTASIIGVNARTDLAIEQNNEYILDEISKGLINVKVINYFTGEKVTVQNMFDYLARLHADNAITFDALADRNKTFTELAELNITYTQLAMNGNILIV